MGMIFTSTIKAALTLSLFFNALTNLAQPQDKNSYMLRYAGVNIDLRGIDVYSQRTFSGESFLEIKGVERNNKKEMIHNFLNSHMLDVNNNFEIRWKKIYGWKGYEYDVPIDYLDISPYKVKADFVYISTIEKTPTNVFSLGNNYINYLFIRNSNDCKISFYKDTINKIRIASNGRPNIFFEECRIGKLIFDSTALDLPIFKSVIPDTLSFKNIDIKNSRLPINLNSWFFNNAKRTVISFDNTPLEEFNFNYKYFQIDTSVFSINSHDPIMISRTENLYSSILALQQKLGYADGVEKVDKEFKKFRYLKDGKYFLNFLDNQWWGYGYNKELIFRNSIILMLVFYIINMLFYKTILHKTYVIEELANNDNLINEKFTVNKIKHFLYKCAYGIIYTGLIFWSVNLDIHKIRFNRIVPALYIIVQFVTGVICLGYLANYIITE